MKRWLLPFSLMAALVLVLAGGGYRGQASPGVLLRVGAAVGWVAADWVVPGHAWESGADDVLDLEEPLGTRSPVQEEEKQEEGEKSPKSSEAPFAATPDAWTPRSLALFFASLKADAPAGAVAVLRGQSDARQHPPRAPPAGA